MIATIVTIVFGALLVAIVGFIAWRLWRRYAPKPLKTEVYQAKWQELQKLCAHKETWSEAVIEADTLLGDVLKKLRVRGGSMGERLVKVQRQLTDNDAAWFGHKLRNRIEAEPDTKLKESEVKQALIGIRQALKDVGALKK